MTSEAKRSVRIGSGIIAGWTVYCFLLAQQSYFIRNQTGDSVTWLHAFLNDAAYCACWVLLTPLILYLGGKLPLAPPLSILNASFHFVLSLLLGAATQLVELLYLNVADHAKYPLPKLPALLDSLFGMADYGGMLYWVVLLLHQSFRYLKQRNLAQMQNAELQAQLAGAQLQALKMQLHPHFLFNALNSLSELIHHDAAAADRMVARISDLLRTFLDSADTREVRLEEEVDILVRYLEIQKIRFEERLVYHIDLPHTTRNAMVPSLILQPLMENAVRHGIANREEPGRIEISACRQNGYLVVSIADNGGGTGKPEDFAEGTGLRNTRRRLEALYGADCTFALASSPLGGIAATLRIPHRDSGQEESR